MPSVCSLNEGSMVRVRFAPSPTGNLHVGNARTAVLNYLLARHNAGRFILRIEDTDLERSDSLFVDTILEDLRWLGLTWDEGPYRQSERIPLYREHLDALLARGHAYKCFCTKEELEAERSDALRRGEPPRYRGKCRALSESSCQALEKEAKPFVVRLRALHEEIRFRDGMHGEISFPRDHVDDFILVRQDGIPSYNFAAAVDDMVMEITDVVRGSDHLSNTPKQIMLFLMFDRKAPNYAHHGLLMGPDKKPLSKRHGATSMAEFKSMGILPEAVVNYLAVIGRSVQHEVLHMEELLRDFSIDAYSGSDSLFDPDKLLWLNGAHLRALPLDRLLSELGLSQPWADRVALLRENGKTLIEIKEFLDIFDSSGIHAEALDHLSRVKGLEHSLPLLGEALTNSAKKTFEEIYGTMEKGTGLARRDLMMLLRIAITGRKSGPPLKEVFRLTPEQVILKRVSCLQKNFEVSPSA
jgi:nondiscriminating glutamyl-tRNA synthetase